MELTPEHIIIMSKNVAKLTSQKDKLEKFLRFFPFQNLLSLKFMNSSVDTYCIELLEKLAAQEESYRSVQFSKCAIEFGMMSVTKLQSPVDKGKLTNALRLLNSVLMKVSSSCNLQEQLVDPERICEILVSISNNGTYDRNNANLSAEILIIALNVQKGSSGVTLNALNIIFEACHRQKAISGMCDIASYVLRMYDVFYNSLIPIYKWISEDICKYLKVPADCRILFKLIRCVNEFLQKYDTVRDRSLATHYECLHYLLRKKLNWICKMCNFHKLHPEAIKILGHVIGKFWRGTSVTATEIKQLILQESDKLAKHIGQWPSTNAKLFFVICHLLYLHDKLLWNSDQIIDALNREVVTLSPSPLSLIVIKSIFFLSSVLNGKFSRRIAVHDHLLLKISLLSANPEIYTFHEAQLSWVLNCAPTMFKMVTLKEWMKNVEEDEKITTVVRACKAEEVLLNILKQQHEEGTLHRAASLIRKLKDNEVGVQVALLLPLAVYTRPGLLKYLFAANPIVPRDTNKALKLCSIMGTLISSVCEECVLKGACTYSKKLLYSLRNVSSSVLIQFCKNSRDIKSVIDMARTVSEATALEIIRLIQVLHVIPNSSFRLPTFTINLDLCHLLKGSKKKTSKALQLFRQMLTLDKPFIHFERDSFLNVFYELLSITHDENLASNAYICLVMLIKKEPKLALTPLASMHVEMNCMMPIISKSTGLFSKYLNNWLQALYDLEINDLHIIRTTDVKNFLKEYSLIDKSKARLCLRLLDRVTWKD